MDQVMMRVYLSTASGLLLFFMTEACSGNDRLYEIQMKRLLMPSHIVKKAEELRSSIFIYDGLRSTDIDFAMDEQFDRIENMMFVRTLVSNEEGEEEVQEDGCD